ncbi:Uncharacterised protein [Enterobacter asburiae]|uniref:Uncharacterized protein n=1 Tax=Enterobacter asburiae TaxID=61645 RepID=A0A376FE30_ENTAS|nr:Uncharacterised protein [Enterobacter asburiae]
MFCRTFFSIAEADLVLVLLSLVDMTAGGRRLW